MNSGVNRRRFLIPVLLLGASTPIMHWSGFWGALHFIQSNEAYAMIYAYQTRRGYIGMKNGVIARFGWFAAMILRPDWLI